MTPHARIEIDGGRGGFLSGVLYDELLPMLKDLYRQGKPAIAYDSAQVGLIVGESDPSVPDRWWARETPPLPLRDNRTRPA